MQMIEEFRPDSAQTCRNCDYRYLTSIKSCPQCGKLSEVEAWIGMERHNFQKLPKLQHISSSNVQDKIKEETIVIERPESSPLDTMVGGTHYKTCGIQPIEFIESNKIGFAKGNIIKYAYRHENKNGLQDLLKVVHYTLLEAHFKYPKEAVAKFKDDVKNLLG